MHNYVFNLIFTLVFININVIYSAKPVLKEHPRMEINMITYDRDSLNAGLLDSNAHLHI